MQTETIKKEYPFDITPINFKITTTSELAQTWFSIGLSQCYNFNHEEAMYCCDQALKHDPNCAMAYFLKSFALGVNYNNIVQEFTVEQAKGQFENYSKAEKNIQNLTKLEILLIQALKERVGNGIQLTHDVNDKNFAVKMKEIHKEFGSDPSVSCLYAESLMNLSPWNLWAQKTQGSVKYGDPFENTLEIKKTLETALVKYSDHVGLRHLYIHCTELSTEPEQALDNRFTVKLRDLAKDQSHLIHMVSHTDLITGNYEEAMIANELAVLAGDRYYKWREQVNKPICSFNNLYRCHDLHFWVYASMFAGQYAKAVDGARRLIQILPIVVLKDSSFFNPIGANWMEGFIPTILHVYIRFGQWERIIQDEPFGEDLISMKQINENKEIYLATNCHLAYARGIAYAVLAGKTKTAEERKKFLELSQEYLNKLEANIKSIPSTYHIFNNKVADVLQIGCEMLKGELYYRQENYEAGFKHLRISVDKYDHLPYDEPWGWMVPSRHALGALLLEYGVQTKNKEIITEAQTVYKQDLGEGTSRAVAHPNNIWSLLGLYQCYVQLGKDKENDSEMKEIKKQLDERMKFSDMQIKSSCFCTIKNLF